MQYMLLLYEDESIYGPNKDNAALREIAGKHMAFARELGASRVTGAGLKASALTTTVRTKSGAKTIHDGPFAETREQLGGFYLIDAPDLDAAIAIAKRVPVSKDGAVEIRPSFGAPPAAFQPTDQAGKSRYVLLIHEDESVYGPGKDNAVLQDMAAKQRAFARALGPAWLGGAGLKNTAAATTVRTKGDRQTIHDGPFGETKEQLGGLHLIVAPTHEAALAIAKQVPLSTDGAVELRPLLAGD